MGKIVRLTEGELTQVIENVINEQKDTNYSNLKKQYISSVEDFGDNIVIKTPNFEMTIPKQNIKQTKQFEKYPKILENNTSEFNGYTIYDRVVQKSPKIKDYNAFIYFPKINYSFANENDLRKQGLLKSVTDYNFNYEEIDDNKNGIREFFRFLVINIKKLNTIDINILTEICKKYAEITFAKATFKPGDIYSQYTVKDTKDGFMLNDNTNHSFFILKKGKNF